jgi:hypothetical protein
MLCTTGAPAELPVMGRKLPVLMGRKLPVLMGFPLPLLGGGWRGGWGGRGAGERVRERGGARGGRWGGGGGGGGGAPMSAAALAVSGVSARKFSVRSRSMRSVRAMPWSRIFLRSSTRPSCFFWRSGWFCSSARMRLAAVTVTI